ncbi:hypothetical protein E2562_024011 [Oryza meyeriana var. granulata]|uniref:Uncharacterized protein n=1 Tax=Oryza meyeriana var. granulata TaxID=110450 RepID=A0A6G1EB99_9ORYZ|nr:hypothetical protein E2562_024011 [Oryza meyeriana var. granulata]
MPLCRAGKHMAGSCNSARNCDPSVGAGARMRAARRSIHREFEKGRGDRSFALSCCVRPCGVTRGAGSNQPPGDRRDTMGASPGRISPERATREE